MGNFRAKSKWFQILVALCLALVLHACGGEDKPFSLVGDTNAPPPTVPGGPDDGGGSTEGCVVNLNSQMQLKVSAFPAGAAAPLEKLDAKLKTVDPIPIKVSGGNLILEGATFPKIRLDTLSDQADIIVHGIAGKNGTGTIDASGVITITGFTFGLEITVKGSETPLVAGTYELNGVNFTTGPVTATGNHNPISVEGKPFVASDKTVALASGITLPTDLNPLSVLNDKIGGGALTATFDGTFDQDPANCTAGGGTPGGTPGGGGGNTGGPSELSVSDGATSHLTEIDFGSTLVIVTQKGEKTILDCTEAGNRGILSKTITITNTGDGDRKIKLLRTQDTDGDPKDPLCSGSSEFVRGSIAVKGTATCTTVKVAGKDFITDECTIPKGDGNSISFPLLFAPFNYVKGESAATPVATPAATPAAELPATSVADTGILKIEYDDGKTFDVNLKGLAEPDVRDSLAIARITDGTVSKKLIRNGKGIKIAPTETEALPFTQDFALLNTGTDSYETITFTLETGTNFSVEGIEGTTVSSGNTSSPAQLKFKIKFSPTGSETAFSDKLTIKMKKVGSTGEVNLIYPIQGIVGEKPILGDYLLQVDYLTAIIDNNLLSGKPPVESLDFRDFQDQAPKPQTLTFADVTDDLQLIDLIPLNFDPLASTVSQRRKALRILNAQGTIGLSGQKLVPGNDSTMCKEPDPINVPYTDGCAYFYFDMAPDPESKGVYDPESGDLTIPDLTLVIQNPYHADVGGVWPASNPNNPSPADNRLDSTLSFSLTTLTLDALTSGDLVLVPDSNISLSDLNMTKKENFKGPECSSDDPIASPDKPHMRCYLTPDGKYLQGHALTLRAGADGAYDVILVGVAKFKTKAEDGTVPVFMDGSHIYVVIQGRLCKDEAACAL